MQLFGSAVSSPKRPNRPTAGFRRERREAIKHRWKSMFWKRGQRQATITVRAPHSALRTPPARTQCTFRKRPRSSAHRPIPLAARIVRSPPTRNTCLTNVLAHLHATPTPPARRIRPKADCAARPLAIVLAHPRQRVSFHRLLRNVCSADVPLRRLTKS